MNPSIIESKGFVIALVIIIGIRLVLLVVNILRSYKSSSTPIEYPTQGLDLNQDRGKQIGWKRVIILTVGFGLTLPVISGIYKYGITEFLAERDGGGQLVFAFIGLLMIFLSFLSWKSPKLAKKFGEPLFGAKQTEQGLVDESVTKHKKWVIALLVFNVLWITTLFVLVIRALLV